MSEGEGRGAPNPDSERSPMLLEAEGPSLSDYAVPAGLGLAGAALIYFAWKGSKKNGNGKSKPKAEANEVVFSGDYKSYTVGDDWIEMTLEPFLAEQAEEYDLITADYEGTMEGLTVEQLRPLMAESRKANLKVFYNSYKVKTSKGEELIAKLPDTKAVREFKETINTATAEFQEQY